MGTSSSTTRPAFRPMRLDAPLSHTMSIARPAAVRTTARQERRLIPVTTSTANTVARMKGNSGESLILGFQVGVYGNAPEPVVPFLTPEDSQHVPAEVFLLYRGLVPSEVYGSRPPTQPVVFGHHQKDEGGGTPAPVLPETLRLLQGEGCPLRDGIEQAGEGGVLLENEVEG